LLSAAQVFSCFGEMKGSEAMAWTLKGLPVRAVTGVWLVFLIALTSPGWLCFAFLPDRRQERMLTLLAGLIEWVRSCS
jgi:hypothetical protein